jgi:hypothetical protein
MQGLVTMIAASAILSAGLVAGLATTDAAARPKPAASPEDIGATAVEVPAVKLPAAKTPAAKTPAAKTPTAKTPAANSSTVKTSTAPESASSIAACAAAWPYTPTACAADGRKVRIIALTAQ